MRHRPFIGVGLFVCMLTRGAFAENPKATPVVAQGANATRDADRLVVEGQELRKTGHDDEALAKFKQAQALAPTPRTLAQIALAEQALGLFPAAETHLEDALASGDSWIAKHRQTLEDARKSVADRLGSLDVRTSVPATLLVDGEAYGTTPLAAPLRVGVGSHVLVVTAEGYERATRTVTVERGLLARESFALAVVAKEPPPAEKKAGPAAPVTVVVTNSGGLKTVGWVFVGGGALLGVVSGVSFVLGEKNATDHNACLKDKTKTATNCSDLGATATFWRSAGLGTAIGGGVLLLGGAAMVLFSTGTSKEKSTTAVSCAPGFGPGAFSLGCAGRF